MRVLPCLAVMAVLLGACSSPEPDPDELIVSARKRLDERDDMAALIDLKSALQVAPDSGEARFLFGKTLLRGGNAAGAELELRKALAAGHPAEDVVPSLAQAMLSGAKYKAVIDEFGRTDLQPQPAQVRLKTTLAAAHAALGQEAQAEAALKQALSLAPSDVQARVLMTRVHMGRRDVPAARESLTQLLQTQPDDAAVWKLKGDMLRAVDGDEAGALAAYRQAIALDRLELSAHVDAIDLLFDRNDLDGVSEQLARLTAVAARHPQTVYLQARLAFRRADYPGARQALQQVLRRAPDYVDALELAGATELALGALAPARAHLQKVIQAAPARPMPRRLLAQVHLLADAPEDALTILQPLMSSRQDAASLRLAAQAHTAQGNAAQAKRLLAQAVKLDPDNHRARTTLALMNLQRGGSDLRLEELQAIAASDDGTHADMALVMVNLAAGRFDAALAALDLMETKARDKARVSHLRGRVLLMRQDRAAARTAFTQALKLRPDHFPSIASLAALDVDEGRPEAAKARLEAALQATPRNAAAMVALAQLAEKLQDPAARVLERYDAAVQVDPLDPKIRLALLSYLMRTHDIPRALEVAQAAAAALPDNQDVMHALAQVQLAAGLNQQALGALGKLAAARPQAVQIHLDMARAQQALGNAQASRQSLMRALALQPDLLDAQQRLVTLEMAAGRVGEAMTVAKSVQKQRPRAAIGHVLEGDIETQRRNSEAALRAYRAALRIEPNGQVAGRLHGVLLGADKGAEAGRFAEEWLAAHPKDVAFRIHLAGLATRASDFARAQTLYEDVIRSSPEHVIALNNLAWTLHQQNAAGALEPAAKAHRISPNYPPAMDTYAVMLAAAGQLPAAVDMHKRAVAADPANPVFRLNLVRTYLKARQPELAEAELRTLAQPGASASVQAEVERLLKSARGG